MNNKIYVGVHKTSNIDDGYMGSGKIIRYAIEKHGINNFRKDILEFFENSELMYAKEKEIITEEFLSRKDVYNIKHGGHGGFDYINTNQDIFLTKKRLSSLMTTEEAQRRWRLKYDNDPFFKQRHLDHCAKTLAEIREAFPDGTFKNRIHRENTKKRMSEIAKERLKDPTKNTQYCTMWITDGSSNKKIKKHDTIPNGWRKGRVV